MKNFNLIGWLNKNISWSFDTFGPGTRTEGVLRHIEEEIEEVRKDPTDTSEWIDIVILALDGAWRAGATAEDICRVLEEKQAKNMARAWPDWRNFKPDEPINHLRT